MIVLIVYLIAMNLYGFVTMGYDKSQAKKGDRRTPERQLFTIAAAGGALGIWLGMRAFRHKTKHLSFVFGVPALLLLNAAAVYLIGYFFMGIFK